MDSNNLMHPLQDLESNTSHNFQSCINPQQINRTVTFTQVDSPEVSVVVPFFNEESCIAGVTEELAFALSTALDKKWEIILVNDGSTDSTPMIMNSFASQDKRIRAIHLRPNSGQSAALEAGFSVARGDFIAVLDGDGQNDPQDIPNLLNTLLSGKFDMVCGIRTKREDSFIRKLSSRIANRIRSGVLGDKITDVGCSIRVFRRCCLARIPFFRNAHRFFPALMIRAGYRVTEIPVHHRPRLSGTSRYGGGIQSRLWVGIVDLLGVLWLMKRRLVYDLTETENYEIQPKE